MSIELAMESFLNFEKNIDNSLGLKCLSDGLFFLKDTLELNNNERDRNRANNLISKYREKVLENVGFLLASGSPDSLQLLHIVKLMEIFTEYGFDEDSNFQEIQSRILIQLVEAVRLESFGTKLSSEDKARLENALKKRME